MMKPDLKQHYSPTQRRERKGNERDWGNCCCRCFSLQIYTTGAAASCCCCSNSGSADSIINPTPNFEVFYELENQP